MYICDMENKIEYEFVAASRNAVVIDKDGYWTMKDPIRCCKLNPNLTFRTKDIEATVICPSCKSKLEFKLITDDKAVVSSFRAVKVGNVEVNDVIAAPDNEGYFTAIRDGKFRFHWPRVFALSLLVCLAILFLLFLFDIVKNA